MTRDLRKYARQTNLRLVVGFLLLALLGGPALIGWLWGREAALLGVACVAAALVPAGAVWLLLALLGWLAKRLREE
jgi:hypothetical protein